MGHDCRLVAIAAVAALAAITAPAVANPAAEQMFLDGRQLLKDGHLDEACDRFAKSQEIEPRVGTLLNLGDCRERQGKFATAWEVFLAAKTLATQQNDGRAAEAGKRAEALAPRRAFMTLVVPAERRVPGLAITRNDVTVPPAEWGTEIPIDPGSYTIVAKAPGYQPVSTKLEVAREGKASATIAALEPVATSVAPIGQVSQRDATTAVVAATMVAPSRRLGLGAILGRSSDDDTIYGVRFIVGYPLPNAVLRGSLSVKYAFFYADPDNNPDNYTNLFAFGAALDYVRRIEGAFAVAGGIGAGLDVSRTAFEPVTDTRHWFTLRLSPAILRFGQTKQFEANLTIEIVFPDSTDTKVLGLLGLDWFVW